MIEQLAYQSIWKRKVYDALTPEEQEHLKESEKQDDIQAMFQSYCTAFIRMGICTPDNAAPYTTRALFLRRT